MMHERTFSVTQRPLSLTALAIVAVVIGVYSLVAGIALLLAGVSGSFGGATAGAAVFVVGALYLGLAAAGLLVGGGFWQQRHWAWAGAMVVLGGVIVVSLMAVLIGANLLSVVIPIVVSAAVMWYMTRTNVRSGLLGRSGEPTPEQESTS